ncbi:hypothetical protein O6H91_05G126500 [Diphasiastrum complanatum]|uniref:Uncharacterized protein n=1 Tax=Diphasiastrum complanatum TaxID=34168 RepID=A0ACC2DT48_DIPCM|nr:hypothetical protein O6H91_05G126500 [Diphasiastrum complanatum]
MNPSHTYTHIPTHFIFYFPLTDFLSLSLSLSLSGSRAEAGGGSSVTTTSIATAAPALGAFFFACLDDKPVCIRDRKLYEDWADVAMYVNQECGLDESKDWKTGKQCKYKIFNMKR